jgi:hypothetical protein
MGTILDSDELHNVVEKFPEDLVPHWQEYLFETGNVVRASNWAFTVVPFEDDQGKARETLKEGILNGLNTMKVKKIGILESCHFRIINFGIFDQ